MFINNINPDIAIGPLNIRFYGIVYALGFLYVGIIMRKHAHRIKNLDKEKATDLVFYGMLFGLIGARLFHVISDWYLYQNNLIAILKIWEGGLGFQGGLAGGLLAIYVYCKKYKIEMLKILDIVSVPFALITGFGRIANYINSEHLGFVADVPWCVVFEARPLMPGCRHPAQLYEALSMFLLFGILLYMSRKKLGQGYLTYSFILGYGVLRFFTDFFRSDYHIYLLGLSHTQIINICMIIIGVYLMKTKVKKWDS